MQDNPRIRVICSADEVCRLCPNNRDGVCETAGLTEGYDTAVMRLCGLGRRGNGMGRVRRTGEGTDTGERAEEGNCGGCQWNDICERKDGEFTADGKI